MYKTLIVTLATVLLTGVAAASDEDLLPTPAELEPNVRFWTRVYTEVDTNGGLIHDSRNMDVVYEVVQLPERASRRTRQRAVEKRKKRYKQALVLLGQGRRSGLTDEQARVLALWPDGTTNKTFRTAASNVRFQLGQADKFQAGLIRAGRWSAFIQRVLDDHGVPRALAALPHVESSFNATAYSRVGAAGLWQFTRSTGRLYMRVDHVIDERMDPWKATVGAARLLRDNQRRLEQWPLAITAYNHGVAGMARAVRTTGTQNIGEISQRYRGRTFGFASRNFYSEFVAAWGINRDPERYFGKLAVESPIDYVIVEAEHYYAAPSLERALGIDQRTLRDHNLALRPSVWNGAKLVPKGYPIRVPSAELTGPAETLLAAVPENERIAQQKRDRWHKVRRGEALSVIARRYHTTQSELVALNNLRSRHRIRAGQVLRLPDDGSAPLVITRSQPPSDGVYRVRRGDSLSIVSARFGVKVDDLVRWNGLRNKHRLAVGQPLRVTAPTAVVAQAKPAPEAPPAVAAPRPAPEARPEPAPEPIVLALTPADAEEPNMTPAAAIPDDEPISDEFPTVSSVVAALASNGATVPDPSNYAVSTGGRITVQAEETLGHYAEWLEVSASRLRRLNNMSYGTPLVIGRRKKLDFSRVTPEVFEQRRLAYHRDLQEEFFAAFEVAGTQMHTLRRGDSIWYLANRKYEIPIWLLRQYNPDLDFGALPAGTPMVIPLLESRSGQSATPPTSPIAAMASQL